MGAENGLGLSSWGSGRAPTFSKGHMRIAILILAFAATPAWAGWEKAATSPNGTFYLDHGTIHKNGDLRQAWQVEDLTKKRPDGTMSVRTLREYDCKADKVRVVSISDHDGAMATGHAIHSSDKPGKWVAIPPSTVISILSKVVCAN